MKVTKEEIIEAITGILLIAALLALFIPGTYQLALFYAIMAMADDSFFGGKFKRNKKEKKAAANTLNIIIIVSALWSVFN
ncbi:MAG: hypothetical protein Q8O94_03340 [bacterium]|nr:hypothetical protein [bacterium]